MKSDMVISQPRASDSLPRVEERKERWPCQDCILESCTNVRILQIDKASDIVVEEVVYLF